MPSAARRRVYLDTSAYLCLLLGENGWERVAAGVRGAEVVSSVLLALEAQRNLVRLARSGALGAEDCGACLERLARDAGRFSLRDLTLELCQSAAMPLVSTPRSLDLAHLRTALWFRAAEGLDRFITMDESQALAARELGLPT